MAHPGLIVRTQELGGQIVAIGGDHARGITTEAENFTADMAGPAGGTLVLKRDPHKQWPDLRAYAPVTILDHGQVVMRGRIKNTPMTDGGISRQASVQIEGMQFHLDDDVYERNYIATDLTKFVEAGSLLGCPIANFSRSGDVSVGDGAITLAMRAGSSFPAFAYVGVTLDFGPGLCDNVAVNWLSSNNTSDIVFFCRGNGTPDGGVAGDDAFSFPLDAAPASFNVGPFAAPQRYVNLFIFWAAGGTIGADCWVKIIPPTSFFAESGFSSGGYSDLRASTVVGDAINRATRKLSADRSLIQQTSFFIPELMMNGPATPREAASAVNDYHGWQLRVRPDNRPEFRPLPALPSIEVGADALFNETSAGDASEIYTDVIVSFTDAAGQQQRIRRSQRGGLYSLSDIQPTNPGGEVNTTGWAASGSGTLSRTTAAGEFSAGVAAFKVAAGANLLFGMTGSAWTGGPFIPGTAHRLLFDIRADAYTVPTVSIDGVVVASKVYLGSLSGLFETGLALDWVQTSASDPVLYFGTNLSTGTGSAVYVDNLLLQEGAPTIINRWGFKRTYRLDVGVALTPAAAEIIGDAFLASHQRTPLKGDLIIPGDGRAWRTPSGQGMRCSEFLGETGELVRMAHLIDPDTGKKGRIGRIVAAAWDPPSGTAKLSLDSESGNFQALLARLGVNVGQVR